MRVISSEPSISVWVTDSNAVWSLVILKYSCITPFGHFISLRKVIISVSFPCVCLSPVYSWSIAERSQFTTLAFFSQAISGLTGRDCSRAVAGLVQFLWAGVCDASALLHSQLPPSLECIGFWNYATQQSRSLYLLCFLGITPLKQYAYACICVFRKFGSIK